MLLVPATGTPGQTTAEILRLLTPAAGDEPAGDERGADQQSPDRPGSGKPGS